jgi:asparagine synthase (glutamine-hydrolysing)
MRRLNEKSLLKNAARGLLPREVLQRVKTPYRAPIYKAFFNADPPEYLEYLLSETQIRRAGLFRPEPVARLIGKAARGEMTGETDQMALVGVISAQLVHDLFIENLRDTAPLGGRDAVKVCDRTYTALSHAHN